MTQGTLFKKRYGPPARARTEHPVQSHAAADRMNKGLVLTKHRMAVLRAVARYESKYTLTAKFLDWLMMDKWQPSTGKHWKGWARRRLPELAAMGLVTRDETGPEMVCSLTKAGRKALSLM